MSVYNTSERGHHMPSPGLHGMRWVRLRQTRLERFQREWGRGTFGTPSISCIPLNNAHKLVAPSDLLTASFPDSAVCCLILRQRGRTRDTRAFISFSFCLTWLCSSPSCPTPSLPSSTVCLAGHYFWRVIPPCLRSTSGIFLQAFNL